MTEQMVAHDEVVAKIDEERQWWEGILAAVGEDRMEEVGVTDQWSFKDLIAHLNGWQRRSLDRLAAHGAGNPSPPPPWPAEYEAIADEDESVERVNDWIYERNRNRPAGDVVAESRQQWDELRALVAAMPEAELNDPTLFPRFEGQSLAGVIVQGDLFGHFHEEHEPMITDWLTSHGRKA